MRERTRILSGPIAIIPWISFALLVIVVIMVIVEWEAMSRKHRLITVVLYFPIIGVVWYFWSWVGLGALLGASIGLIVLGTLGAALMLVYYVARSRDLFDGLASD